MAPSDAGPRPRPFEGLRVLDLTHVLAGPFCAYQLAVLGADVIKIEPPHTPDCARGRGPDDALNAAGLGINYQVQGANKRALALDLADPRGRALFLRLVDGADVVIENFRTGALAALGLGAEALTAANPRLIHCTLTGYGATGERAGVNAYDNVIQAASGLMARTGTAETGPLKAGASVIDYATGYAAAFAIAAALVQRARTGHGQTIDCAMFDTALTLMAPEASAALYAGTKAPRPSEAGIGAYRTADGELVMLGAFNVRQNRRLWQALGRPEFASIADWNGLWAASGAMRDALAEVFATRTAADWEAFLHGIGVPAERVRRLDEAVRLPHLAARGLFAGFAPAEPGTAPVALPLAAFRYAAGGPELTRPPPRHGEHSAEILAGLGCSADEIAALRADGVIA
ncbi:CaiB/BaiF CoA transferase family protein [Elioraea sp.]|uniref:CaiB/BaiF CoA transferase family protein n=1 Tax=Elioraea sp. TaxID=2185103 RepID=UPI003F6E70A1